MSLYVQIKRGAGATVNYGPSPGINAVTGIEGDLQGPGKIGQMNVYMVGVAAGFDIRARDLVKIFESPDGGVTLTNRVFLGFVNDIERVLTLGNRLVVYVITCVDANVLEDWMRMQVSTIHGVEAGGETRVDRQIQRICRAVVTNNPTNAADPFDVVSGMALSAPLLTDITFDYMGLSLRDMLDKRLKAFQASYPTTRPRQYMGFTTTGHAADFLPQLNVIDETALLASAPKYTFSWEPSGSDKKMRSLRNKRTGANLTTSVQASALTQGPVLARSTSTNTSVYPNTFDLRPFGVLGAALNAWDGPLLKLPDGASGVQVQAAADQEIAADENPGETFVFVTDDQLSSGLLPGDTVAISAQDLSLSGYKRVVSSVRVWYEHQAGAWVIVREVTAGNQLPELGSTRQATYPVQEGDFVAPLPPASVSGAFYDAGSMWLMVRLTYPASASNDVVRYRYYFTINGSGYLRQSVETPPPTTFDEYFLAGSDGSVYITAVDNSGNEGAPSPTLTWTGNDSAPAPTKDLYNGDFAYRKPGDITKPHQWVETVGAAGVGVIATTLPSGIKTRQALKITCGVADTDLWVGPPVSALSLDTATGTQFQLAMRVLYFLDGTAAGTLQIGLRYYDASNSFSSAANSFLINGTPTGNATKTLTGTFKSPSGCVYVRPFISYSGPIITGSRNLYVAAFSVGPAGVSAASGADALATTDTTGHLAVPTTSGTKTGRPSLAGSEVGLTWDSAGQRVQVQTATLDYFIGATSASGGIWEPLTNGDATTPELIFVGGDVIMIGG